VTYTSFSKTLASGYGELLYPATVMTLKNHSKSLIVTPFNTLYIASYRHWFTFTQMN